MFRSPKILQWLFPSRIWGISVSTKTVFLTFDDGPDPEITPWLLDFLEEQKVKATFFCVGSNVVKEPEIFARIVNDGHAIGNHTMNHEKEIHVSSNEYLNSIDAAASLIDSHLFRPPYGRLRKSTEAKVPKKYKIVMWSWLSYDYDVKVPVAKIIQHAEKIKSGDILVFHDNKKTKSRLVELLPTVIQSLKTKGFGFEIIK